MGIWNSFRRFSAGWTGDTRQRSKRKQDRTARPTKARELRLEQFEQRLLLSINPAGIHDNPLWDQTLANAIDRAVNLEGYSEEALAATDRWVVGISDLRSMEQTAAVLSADSLGEATGLPNSFVWEFSGELGWEEAVARLGSTANVEFFYPLVAQQQSSRLVPDDPLFSSQWYLYNAGQTGGTAGMDTNVVDIWDTYQGSGVLIAIVDDGIDYTHEDIDDNYRADLSYDYNFFDADPMHDLPSDGHGTSVAGVAAAEGDNALGVSGVAPEAELVGLRLLSLATSDFEEASALSSYTQLIDIYNNSWGPPDGEGYIIGPGPATSWALQYGTTYGRVGLGNIYIWAAGNGGHLGDNVNYDGYANSRYTIAVAAVDHNGQQAPYSEPGAPLLVSAFSDNYSEITGTVPGDPGYVGITTTDWSGSNGYELGDYTSTFGGTSSAAPLVSGVVALMLEANPLLTYRDVQHILVQTAVRNDPLDSDWYINDAGHGYYVNHKYGFGVVDAAAAVQAAVGWELVGPEVSVGSGSLPGEGLIPDNSDEGVISRVVLPNTVGEIEWVEVTFNAPHANTGDLEVTLISPAETESVLAEPHIQTATSNNQFNNWTFTTARHWGEESGGQWTLIVKDLTRDFPFGLN